MKLCTKCGNEYADTLVFFPPDSRTKDGFGSYCRECCRRMTAFSRAKRAGYYREYSKKYQRENKKQLNEQRRKYHATIRGYVSRLIGRINVRCSNIRYCSYNRYGGRGIKCLFTGQELYDWLEANNIDPRGLQIHRIDNDGDYVLGNIEFLSVPEHKQRHREMRSN